MNINDLKRSDVTPESIYLNRRKFLETSIYTGTGLATFGAYRYFRGTPSYDPESNPVAVKQLNDDTSTPLDAIAHYNNFYEFSTDKEAVARAAEQWTISDWKLEISGLVEDPFSLGLQEIAAIRSEERIYRFRCVEGWSMIIPWLGFPLAQLLEKSKPHSQASYVAFESYYDPTTMPEARFAGIPFPYVEGLRLDEAMHPLTFIATGLYGKRLPNQNGAPLRLIVPWKYGFKSIKSVVKIVVTDKEPPTTWNLANAQEYGFYSNVNPEVDHPRWSQATERRIGEIARRETLPFNGYSEQVASLYKGMDLRKYF